MENPKPDVSLGVTICWTCQLPIPNVPSPIGAIADPMHNCLQALKAEVWSLRSKLAEIILG